MDRNRLFAGLTALLVAAPAAADRVLVVANHTDEFSMMGQTQPAQDTTQEYWFSADAVRYDMGDRSIVVDLNAKKLFMIDHEKKQYSPIQLPIHLEEMLGSDNGPMVEQMMKMMAATSSVTPLDRTGEFAGHPCKYYKVDVSMAMMQTSMDTCLSSDIQIDYSKYRELVEAQSELIPNLDWLKEMTKLEGFPVRTDSTMTVMGKTVSSWQELKSVEDREPPPGHYAPPSGYEETQYDPMQQMARGGRR